MSDAWTRAWQVTERYWAEHWREWLGVWVGAALGLTALLIVNPSVNQVLFIRLHANNTTHWVNLPHFAWRGGPTALSVTVWLLGLSWWTAGVLGSWRDGPSPRDFGRHAVAAWGRAALAFVEAAVVLAAIVAVSKVMGVVAPRDAALGVAVLLGLVVLVPLVVWLPPMTVTLGVTRAWAVLRAMVRTTPLEVWALPWLLVVTQVLNGMLAAAVAWTVAPWAGQLWYALVWTGSLLVFGTAAVAYGQSHVSHRAAA